MNSMRPLATISILGIVGLFLYMKINESDPVVPADAINWDVSGDLDIGSIDIGGNSEIGELEIGDSSAVPVAQTTPLAPATEPSTAPAYAGVTAPAYPPQTTHDVTSSTATAQADSGSPPFAATPEPSTTGDTQSSLGQAVPAAAQDSSKLPPLPALPATADHGIAGSLAPNESPAPFNSEVVGQTSPSTSAPVSTESTNNSLADSPVTSSFAAQGTPATTESLEPQAKPEEGQASLFSATRLAVQSALDRGELSQALLLLSDWYGDPSLTAAETAEVQELLSQLAGSVIYSTEHRLEPPYMVQAGEKLSDIAQKYNVPWQLLSKINGISDPDQLQPGQQLKVLRGPFSARIDLSDRAMVLMLDRRYAGQFPLDIAPSTTVEEGYWSVNQKLLTPGNVSSYSASPTTPPSDERSILLTNSAGATGQITVLRGPGTGSSAATDPPGRVIQLKGTDVNDVYDILSLGSQVIIRR